MSLLANVASKAVYSPLLKPLLWLCGNRPMQELLALKMNVVQHLMGIGSGSEPETSGERVLCRILRRCVSQTPVVVFDGGANLGQFSRMMMKGMAPIPLQMHLFEPSPYASGILRKEFGGTPGVVVNEVALGKQSGRATLYSNADGSGVASLTKRENFAPGVVMTQAQDVAVTTVDDYCEAKGITRVDLLKLDVEGHEMDVLRGAVRSIDRRVIERVSFEFGGPHIDTRTFLKDFFFFFSERGMVLDRITRSGYLHRLDSYKESEEIFRATNFLATRRK